MIDPKEVKALHRQAMESTDFALSERKTGNEEKALVYFREAYELEVKAARAFIDSLDDEPNRSVLFRSAASLAIDCKLTDEAEKLICVALAGNPPAEIAEELRDLLGQVHFHRHLELKGFTLNENEVQLSIDGDAIGYGIAPTNTFLKRVESTESLLYRTGERKQNKPYRDRGRRQKNLEEDLELFMTVPRAASFAVTFKIGASSQINIPGIMSPGEEIISELLDCLELFARGSEEELKKRIPEEAYFRNFVGLARNIAPDGKEVNLVGFTTSRRGEIKKVSMTSTKSSGVVTGAFMRPAIAMPPPAPSMQPPTESSFVQVSGFLLEADSRRKDRKIITLIDAEEKSHTIEVPPGLMSDVVRPYWESRVTVTGISNGKVIILHDIGPAD